MDRFVDYAATKRGMGVARRSIVASSSELTAGVRGHSSGRCSCAHRVICSSAGSSALPRAVRA
jgi:hypothetical protein